MPNLKVNTTITAPENIDIEFVRADVMQTSATFRYFFEIFLSLTSTLIGYALSLTTVTALHWTFLAVCVMSMCTFLKLSLVKKQQAKVQN